jgi:phosphoribosylamine---glycine ligase
MKVLVIGSGGREHALVWKIRQSPRVQEIYCAPGNGGISQESCLVPLGAEKVEELARFVRNNQIDLTIVGPELPLTLGIVDYFEEKGLPIVGPSQAAARLEGSKIFAKEFMQRHGIPTAAYFRASTAEEAFQIVRKPGLNFPLVLKADGLAAGKGVIIAGQLAEAENAIEQIMKQRSLGAAGEQIIVEEFLEGEEASFLVFSDGVHALPMRPSQDHKRINDNDEGPNTGGMGAYCADFILTPSQHDFVMKSIVGPVIQGMAEEGYPYRGILYVGLMLTQDGPKVLEFNVRMGDPETQPVLFRLKSDWVEVCEAILAGRLDQVSLDWEAGCTVCVVLSSGGYPGKYPVGKKISGLEAADRVAGVKVFHAGTRVQGDEILTSGGRVLGVTARGAHLAEAIQQAYQAVELISFDQSHFRRDIGAKGLALEKKVSSS